jgi:hypothetical protein
MGKLRRITEEIRYTSIGGRSRMLDEGVWAEIKAGGEHLRLFSERNALGVQASVYDVNAKKWIAPSESVEDIEKGKEKVAEYAKAFLKAAASAELPPLIWKKARTA